MIQSIFSGNEERLAQYRLAAPRVVRFQREFEALLGYPLPKLCLTEEQLAIEIARVAKEERESK